MKIAGTHRRTIHVAKDGWSIEVIDQRRLPHALVIARLTDVESVATAISQMWVRGAPLIGVAAAYGVALAMRADASDASLERAVERLIRTRPTAINLKWALDEMRATLSPLPQSERVIQAYAKAAQLADDDVAVCRRIAEHGLKLLEAASVRAKGQPVNVLTHCNAGWLATVDWGTALAPVYLAHEHGIPLHVWVDETRPRNQGASLTAWELAEAGIPHTLIADNVGGHLMQHGRVALCLVGSDRTTARGDVCNKIGTYLKALAAKANDVPFYVALPSSSIDWSLNDGLREIPIEEREGTELTWVSGRTADGRDESVQIAPEKTPALNFGFDVTPAELVSGLITERGVCAASRESMLALFPERKP